MKKLSEEMKKLPEVEVKDLPEVKDAELPKEVEEDRDIHADDGEQKRPEAEEVKAETEKEAKDELMDRTEDIVKNINDAETPKAMANNGEGKNVKIKGLTERLTLEEPSDILTEGIEEEVNTEHWKKVEMLINDMDIRPEDILEHMIQWLPSDELQDCINDFISDNDLEDEFDFIDEDFPSSALDEAIPRDLAKSYRKANYGGSKGARTDLQNSEYKEVTPEEAKELYKKDPTSIKLLIDGQLIDFRSNGKPSLDHRNTFLMGGKEYTRSSGKIIRDTRRMPLSHLLSISDKIYQIKEVEKDPDLLAQRKQNPESPNSDWVSVGNLMGRNIRGNTSAPFEIDYSRKQINTYRDYIKRNEKKLADLETEHNNGEITDDYYNDRKQWYQDEILDYQRRIEARANRLKDDSARRRFGNSENSLRKSIEAKGKIRDAAQSSQEELDSAKDDLEDVKANGSFAARRYKRDLAEIERKLKELEREHDLALLKLDGIEDEDAAAVKAAEEKVNDLTARSQEAIDRWQELLKKIKR